MKPIILFNSHVYTVKSVYRKKLRDGTIKVFLTVLETDRKFVFDIEDNNEYEFLKKGAIITIHLGNGRYIFIEEGEKLPENNKIYYAEVNYVINERNRRSKKNNK